MSLLAKSIDNQVLVYNRLYIHIENYYWLRERGRFDRATSLVSLKPKTSFLSCLAPIYSYL